LRGIRPTWVELRLEALLLVAIGIDLAPVHRTVWRPGLPDLTCPAD
jgi:hypothetical protein